MESEPQAQHWVRELGIVSQVELLPVQTRLQMAELFRQSRLAVSPSNHDGTPNTLLEAMACGTLPVVGDLESVREWITDGENGLLVNPNNPQALADAILQGLEDEALQRAACQINLALIEARAEYTSVMRQAGDFYSTLVDEKNAVAA
jgi:glycosyltransferase involved in cell wall biosynthesis